MVPRKKKRVNLRLAIQNVYTTFFYIISESYNKLIIFLYMCFVIKTKEIILFAVMTDELDIFKHP